MVPSWVYKQTIWNYFLHFRHVPCMISSFANMNLKLNLPRLSNLQWPQINCFRVSSQHSQVHFSIFLKLNQQQFYCTNQYIKLSKMEPSMYFTGQLKQNRKYKHWGEKKAKKLKIETFTRIRRRKIGISWVLLPRGSDYDRSVLTRTR